MDRKLRATAWHNLGRAHEQAGGEELSRVALATSAQLGSSVARQRLKERSLCAATWKTDREDAKEFAASYQEVIAKRMYLACSSRGKPVDNPPLVPTDPGGDRMLACYNCGPMGGSDCDGRLLYDGSFMGHQQYYGRAGLADPAADGRQRRPPLRRGMLDR